jgi:hypothetical protein
MIETHLWKFSNRRQFDREMILYAADSSLWLRVVPPDASRAVSAPGLLQKRKIEAADFLLKAPA